MKYISTSGVVLVSLLTHCRHSLKSLLLLFSVCPVNEYVGGSPDACQPCPAMSSSPGGVVRMCLCMEYYGRVNESYPSLPCVGKSIGP